MQIHILDLNFLDSADTIASFLIETSEGPVLVESGPHSTLPTLEAALQQKGYALSSIGHVFLTHIHLDHAGGAWALAKEGARIYVHPIGAPHLIDPSRLMSSAKRIYQDQMDYLWGKMEPIPSEQVVQVAHGQQFQIGDQTFTGWHTPGHAIHHVAWHTGSSLFAGDVAGVRIGTGPVVPPCPPPDIHLEDWEQSIRLIRKLGPSSMYLTHYGKVNDLNVHLNELQERMWAWANWIRPHFEAGKQAGEVSGAFLEYVESELRTKGVDETGLVQYNKANPPFMSVAGLMRYWKKRTERAIL